MATNVTVGAGHSYSSQLQQSASWRIFFTYHSAITFFIIILILFGNVMTLTSLVKFRHLWRQKNALIGSMSLADLCIGVAMVIWIVHSMLFGGVQTWDITDILLTVCVFITVFHLYIIGVDRFIAVVKPLHYPMLVTNNTTVIMILVSWLLPMVIFIPLYVYALYQDDNWNMMDTLNGNVIIATYVITVLIFSVLYGKILSETRAQLRQIRAWEEPLEDVNSRRRTVNNKGTRLIMIILSTAVFLNFPYFLQALLRMNGVEENIYLSTLEYVAQQCLLSNSCINFFIYAAFTSEFRKAYKTLLCCCKKRQIRGVQENESISYMS